MVPNICIQIVATTFSLFTRMLFYTTPFTFILVPDILEELDVETRKTMVLILGVMLTCNYSEPPLFKDEIRVT